MILSHRGALSRGVLFALLSGVSIPVVASPVNIINDNFSTSSVLEDQITIDSFTLGGAGGFSTLNGTNVDVLGNIGSIPNGDPDNLVPFEGICAASDASANCVDLDGTGTNTQGQLESAALSLTAGTYVLSYDLLGPQGYLTSSAGMAWDVRNNSAATTIIFGNSGCIASPSALNCIYYNSNLNLSPEDTTDGNITSLPLTVSAGTDYIEFISDTPGASGDLLTDVGLIETEIAPVPEPSTLALVGGVLLGVGSLGRVWARRKSR